MKWNYEKCKAEALKYKTRKELQLNNPSIYAKIKGSKWFELYNHMKTKNNWSYEECKIEALKYNTRRELMDNNITIHSKICRNKWYELYQHMERLNYWTYEECREEALKYKTKKDLKINNHKIYDKISQEKWYELYEHTEIIGNKYKRLIYAYEFPDNFCYIGLTFNMDIRNNQHFSDKTSYVFIHNKETNLIPKLVIKSNYIDVEKAAILEGEIKAQYEKNGWNILNKIKTGGIGGSILKWNYESCKEEALKYTNMTEFIEQSKGAYSAIKKYGWDNLYSHIERCSSKNYWNNKELCRLEALKYNSMSEFNDNCYSGYHYSIENGWIDEFFGIKPNLIGQRSMKAIIQYDKNMCEIKEFKSITEASLKTGIDISSISKICRGIRNSINGYIFKYKKED